MYDNGDPQARQKLMKKPVRKNTDCKKKMLMIQHVPVGLTTRKQALVDNIDAWAMWISPPVFILFNFIYWISYR